MSFHWNLSSEDEFDDDEAQDQQETTSADFPEYSFQSEPTNASRSWPEDAATEVASLPIDRNQSDPFEDDDEVDWEDADHDHDDSQDVQAESKTLTIDMAAKPPEGLSNLNKRKRIRQVYKHSSLPLGMQRFVTNLHRANLLSLLSRSVLISRSCSDHLLLHVALSLVPSQLMAKIQTNDISQNVPTMTHLREFCNWFFDFIHNFEHRRRRQHAANVAAGAPRAKRQKGNPKSSIIKYGHGTTSSNDLLDVCDYISPANDENPQLHDVDFCVTGQQKVQLLVTIARAIGWRARHVSVLDPMSCHLDMNHPLLLSGVGNVFKSVQEIHDQDRKQPAKAKQETAQRKDTPFSPDVNTESSFVWAEIMCQPSKAGRIANKYRWTHVDPVHQLIDRPRHVESFFHVRKFGGKATERKRRTIGFALAVEHLPAETVYGGTYNLARLTDVTRRYVNSWSTSLRLRDDGTKSDDRIFWWDETIDRINYDARYQATWVCGDVFGPSRKSGDKSSASGLSKAEAIQIEVSSDDGYDRDLDEQEELMEAANQETMPTSKAGFKNHPLYVLESQLGVAEVLAPDAKKRVRGIFKGELVFSRSEASTAMVAKKWMYEGRKVKDDEMGKPIKRIPARKKPTKDGFQALDTYGVGHANDGSEEARQKEMAKAECEEKEYDGMLDLYAIWQTTPWSPDPVGPDDEIPVNEYKNVELALINPGLFHLEAPRMSVVAKNLGIPYAPCLLGFEGHGGNRTPTIRGIVVHEHNAELLTEAYAEFQSQALEQENQVRQSTILRRWKKLITGLLIKAHVDREYGDDDEEAE